MKMTVSDAITMVKTIQRDIRLLLKDEENNSMFNAANIENAEELRPAYDFAETQKKLCEYEEKIRKIKHAVNVFNTTTVLPGFDKTVDEMLVYMPQLTERVSKLREMYFAPERERVEAYNKATTYIDYRYTNYNKEQVTEEYKKLNNYLTRAQKALDKLNLTETFEVDI